MSKIPLVDSQVPSEVRKIYFILPLSENREEKRFRNELRASLNQFDNNLSKKIEMLNLGNRRIKRVPISIGKYVRHNEEYSDTINKIDTKSSLRILLHLAEIDSEKIDKSLKEEFLKKNRISHLIEIEPGNTKNEITISDMYADTKIVLNGNNTKSVLMVIEDIVLDIAMFYSFFDNKILKNNFEFKRNISKQKIAFAIEKNLEGPFKMVLRELNYCSLATFSRKDNGFDYDKYNNLWNEFVGYLKRKENIPFDLKHNEVLTSKLGQFKEHKDYGEIGINKIIYLTQTLSSGEYILARTTKRPSKNKLRETIMIFMGRGSNNWKKGVLRVFPIDEYYFLSKYSPFISLFKFKI